MKLTAFKYVVLILGVLSLASCSITRRVPDGSYLLMQNRIKVDKQTPKKERIAEEDIEKYIRQKPNRRFLGTNLYLQIYNLAKPGSEKWMSRTLRKIGEAPVLLDTTMVKMSSSVISDYVHKRGFYNSENTYTIDTSKRKKAVVTYSVQQNEPYRIGRINYRFRDEVIRSVIMQDSASTLLHTGDVLDSYVLQEEKMRIVRYLKDRGYYFFEQDNIEFFGDSTVGGRNVDITMLVRQYLANYTEKGEPIYENNRVYRYRDIYVTPDYDPLTAASDSTYLNNADTMEYRGLNIIVPAGQKVNVRRKILRRTINMYPNSLYSVSGVQEAYSNLMRLGYFKNTRIIFDTVRNDGMAEVTFIGGGEENTQATTTEGYMDCRIYCMPALKHSYKIDLEATTSSNFYGLSASVGYQNRNLFRGVELFDVSLRGGYEFMKVTGQKGAFEIGGSTSLSFPRFIAPFKVDRYNRRVNPRTKLELSYNVQRRNYYRRTLSGVNFGYSWSNRHSSSFVFRPIDVNLVDISYLSDEFFNEIKDSEYLVNSYKSQLIMGMSGSYVYNSQLLSRNLAKSFLVRFNWETAGNLMQGLTNLFGSTPVADANGAKYHEVLGIRYAQYVRGDVSVSDRIALGPKTNIAYRVYGGAAWAYGNSRAVPFDRMFFSGGTNSMRGWVARTLGPGNTYIPEKQKYPYQQGDLKLEVNTELRFPVWGILYGALFFDVGNVWMLKGSANNDESVFKVNRFYRQLGFNTGLGARFDISMLVIRFDWGMKVHDPTRAKGERWIDKFHFSNTALNFGVGYPF